VAVSVRAAWEVLRDGVDRGFDLLPLLLVVPAATSVVASPSGASTEFAGLEGVRVGLIVHRHGVKEDARGGFFLLHELQAAGEELVVWALEQCPVAG
jgi:hypothetical protein